MRNASTDGTIRGRWMRLLPFLSAAPAWFALALSLAVFVLVGLYGRAALLDRDINLAEAAYIGDVGRVYRLLESGLSAEATYPIRPGAPLYLPGQELTPLRAAVAGDRPAVTILLLKEGTVEDPAFVTAVWCLARSTNKSDVAIWIERDMGMDLDASLCPQNGEAGATEQ